MAYALDKTAKLAANKVNSEILDLTGTLINTAVVPLESLFYRQGVVIRTGDGNTGTLLKEGVDYIFVLPCTTLAAFWGRIAYGAIFFLTNKYNRVYMTYQAVGGEYARGTKALKIDLASPTDILRKTWEEVISVPEPDRPDLTLHVDNTGTMAKLMEAADAVATTITTLGKI